MRVACERARTSIEGVEVPLELERAIRAAMEGALSGPEPAIGLAGEWEVRSSATTEDAVAASFAGLRDSVLGAADLSAVSRRFDIAGHPASPSEQCAIGLATAWTIGRRSWRWWCNGRWLQMRLACCSRPIR